MKSKIADSNPAKVNRYYKDMTKNGMRISFIANREYNLAKDKYTATMHDDFMATSIAVRDRIVERWMVTQERYHDENLKRVYYFSMEFLIGRLLGTNIINLGLEKETKEALKELGFDINEIAENGPRRRSWQRRPRQARCVFSRLDGYSRYSCSRLRHKVRIRHIQSEDHKWLSGRAPGRMVEIGQPVGIPAAGIYR